MRYAILLCSAFLMLQSGSAYAAGELISPRPHCATIKNTTKGSLFGVLRSNYGTTSDGQKKRHESTFRLEAGEGVDACSSGPFFPGYQVELIIKTMIPVFSCKTKLRGTIEIRSERTKDDKNKYSVTCLP